MISLIIAGGMYMAAAAKPTDWPDIDNHTLKGEPIAASKVVCRTMWGTPMLPDGKGGYSLIAPINEAYIHQSLIIPPWNIPSDMTTQDVIFRPLPDVDIIVAPPAAAPAPSVPAPATPSTLAPAGGPPAGIVEPAALPATPDAPAAPSTAAPVGQ